MNEPEYTKAELEKIEYNEVELSSSDNEDLKIYIGVPVRAV